MGPGNPPKGPKPDPQPLDFRFWTSVSRLWPLDFHCTSMSGVPPPIDLTSASPGTDSMLDITPRMHAATRPDTAPAHFACPLSPRPELVLHHASNGRVVVILSTRAVQRTWWSSKPGHHAPHVGTHGTMRQICSSSRNAAIMGLISQRSQVPARATPRCKHQQHLPTSFHNVAPCFLN